MGFLEGLDSIKENLNSKGSEDRVKAKWLSLKGGETVKLVFLQELDKTADNYSEKNGLGRVYLEHSNPDNWRKSAECTVDEGFCYGCKNGWRQKGQLYINVLVDDGKNEPYVAVLSRGTGKGSVTKLLYEYAADDGTITDKWFKFKREGTTKDNTTYILMPSKAHEINVEDHEVYDLGKVVFHVDPERQEAYYNDGQDAGPSDKPLVSAGATDNTVW
jgi:hypothetical protein